MTTPFLGLALGGGGARGVAHIGVLQELEKSGRVELPDNSAALREGLGKTSEEMQALAGRLQQQLLRHEVQQCRDAE